MRYLVCITGASGAYYGIRTMQAIIAAGHEILTIVSSWGEVVIKEETGKPFWAWTKELGLSAEAVYDPADLSAQPASGSFQLSGTVIVPCSMNSVGAIASGLCLNLIHRAALTALKERRPLILVPRETPLSLIDLRNLTTAAEAGATVLPAAPAFYHAPQTINDIIDFIVGKTLDQLNIEHTLYQRWKQPNDKGQKI